MNINIKSLSMKLKSSQAYSIAVSGFVFAATLFFRIRDKISITILPQFIVQLTTILRAGKLAVSFTLKQVGNIVTTINAKRISLNATASEIGKIVTEINFSNPMVIISSAVQRLISNVKTGKLVVAITPTLASFFLLGTFDPSTLGTLDTETLGDMDYTS